MKTAHFTLLAVLGAAGMALGQPGQPAAPAPTPPATTTPPPPTAPAAGQPDATLITRNNDGSIKRLEAPPEEAALEHVGLSDTEKAAADLILAERAAALDKILAEHVHIVLKFIGVRQGDTQKERMQALSELTRALKPIREGPKLRDQLAAVIAPEKAVKMNQIAAEYRTAIFQETMMTLKVKGGQDANESQARGYETLLAVGAEVNRSYERAFAAKESSLDAVLKKAGVSAEQEAKVAPLSAEYTLKTQGKATPDQRREFLGSVLKELTDEQKVAVLKELYGVK